MNKWMHKRHRFQKVFLLGSDVQPIGHFWEKLIILIFFQMRANDNDQQINYRRTYVIWKLAL